MPERWKNFGDFWGKQKKKICNSCFPSPTRWRERRAINGTKPVARLARHTHRALCASPDRFRLGKIWNMAGPIQQVGERNAVAATAAHFSRIRQVAGNWTILLP